MVYLQRCRGWCHMFKLLFVSLFVLGHLLPSTVPFSSSKDELPYDFIMDSKDLHLQLWTIMNTLCAISVRTEEFILKWPVSISGTAGRSVLVLEVRISSIFQYYYCCSISSTYFIIIVIIIIEIVTVIY